MEIPCRKEYKRKYNKTRLIFSSNDRAVTFSRYCPFDSTYMLISNNVYAYQKCVKIIG